MKKPAARTIQGHISTFALENPNTGRSEKEFPRLDDAARDVEEAIAIANDSDYGLSSSVWSTDLEQASAVAARLNDGMTFVNEHAVTAAGLPFGGINRSGYGRELARWGVGEFVNEHLYRVSGQDDAGQSPAL
ncbi:Succinate semialdehyde dehydrogenase [NAD(P)+] Sad [Corynebacterium confusum]|nr:Succinate semialdehyde dehydrogenase [NAD(P)+] Sad [Corynebacterium confusum]